MLGTLAPRSTIGLCHEGACQGVPLCILCGLRHLAQKHPDSAREAFTKINAALDRVDTRGR